MRKIDGDKLNIQYFLRVKLEIQIKELQSKISAASAGE
jgi:hypothetical protein